MKLMIILILVCIILYMAYKEYKYAKHTTILINTYLLLLKISYSQNKKETLEHLTILLSLMNTNLPYDEWDNTLTILAKAWQTVPVKGKNGVDGLSTMKNIAEKLDYSNKDPDFRRVLDDAISRISELED